jgi:Centromere DNA-binding protein complex CBF3 subunit, domain 2
MAGFETTDGYFLPRGRALPPAQLCEMIWPWIDFALEDALSDAKPNPTARYFLEFLKSLRIIILQDAAAMFVLLGDCDDEGERRRLYHSIFNLHVFQTDMFADFIQEMRVKLIEATDPNDTAIAKALPGVNRKFDDLVQALDKIYKTIELNEMERQNAQRKIEDFFQRVEEKHEERHRQTASAIAGILQHGADAIRGTMAIRAPVEEQQFALSFGGAAESAQPKQQFEHHQQQKRQQAEPGESDVDVMRRVLGLQVSFRNKNTKRCELLKIYKEYYGLDEFAGVPIDGGFYGLEVKFKNNWRKGVYSNGDNTFFSRLKALMVAMAASAGVQEGELTDEVVVKAAQWQRFLRDGGLGGCVTRLQEAGLVAKKGNRSRVSGS